MSIAIAPPPTIEREGRVYYYTGHSRTDAATGLVVVEYETATGLVYLDMYRVQRAQWEGSAPTAGPRSLEHDGHTYHATGKVGMDRRTGLATMEYQAAGGRRLWAAAGVVVEADA
jgi:hypothetical protein